MKSYQAEGKTLDEAIYNALNELGMPMEMVDIEVLENPAKGFMGIGNKLARVRVTEKERSQEPCVAFLEGLLDRMGITNACLAQETDEALVIDVSGPNMGRLIGHRGDTLDAVQYLTSLVANKHREDYLRVTVDTERYRAKRSEALEKLAKNMARRVQQSGRAMYMEPMNPYERMILHSTLQDDPYVTTASEGEEPNRRVVISPKA